MEAIYWGKATIASEPSDEHDPPALAVLENVGGGAGVTLAAPLPSAL